MKVKFLSTALIMAVSVILWLQLVTIPHLEKETAWIEAQADSIMALPPEVKYLPGKTDTTIVRDTLYTEPDIGSPELNPELSVDSAEVYDAAFNDGFIKGTISATLYREKLTDLGFNYRLIKPLESYSRTDTVIQKVFFPKLIETPSRPNKKSLIFLAGLRAGGNQESFSLAPEAELITRQRIAYSYSYDLMRKEHWIGVKFPLFGKQ
jgi:hypothetical protein